MTKGIQEQILRITSKLGALKLELQELREVNKRLTEEMKSAEERQNELQMQLTECREELEKREKSLAEVNEQIKVSANPQPVNREEEIDELVKEIEFCIAQLKR